MIRVRGLQPGAAAGRVAAWPWPIKVRALGELAVWQDDQPLPVGPRAQRTPLALLRAIVGSGAYGGRSVAGERLAEALWPEADGDTALHTLDVTLLRLRKLLGHHGAVRLHGGRVSLSPEHCWVDAQALRALLEQPSARARHGADALADEADAAAAMLDLYRGPLLDGDGDGAVGPFTGEVERLRGQVGRRLRALLERLRGRDPMRASELAARAREQDRGLAAYLPDETAATGRRATARA